MEHGLLIFFFAFIAYLFSCGLQEDIADAIEKDREERK